MQTNLSYSPVRLLRLLPLLLLFLVTVSCANRSASDGEATAVAVDADTMAAEAVEIHPIYHGSVVLTQGDRTIFVDPHGGAVRYEGYAAPDLVLISHTHGDHMDTATLAGLDLSATVLVAPQAVLDALTDNRFAESHPLANGETYDWEDVAIEAVPAYNPPPKQNFHPRGEFNGYVINIDGERYYFSGDTEGVPEMRALENIDYAFVCMNLPYTMDVEQATSAVLEFAPTVVYPYHYRNQDGTKSDIQAFATAVEAGDPDIEVRLENWYTE